MLEPGKLIIILILLLLIIWRVGEGGEGGEEYQILRNFNVTDKGTHMRNFNAI